MATIPTLVSQGALIPITVPIGVREHHARWFYGLPHFKKWLDDDVPKLVQGRLSADESPQEQIDFRLYQWIVGRPMTYSKQFKDLMPGKDEVWEMKTADLRVFGWMCLPKRFIAVFGDYADLYKGPRRSRSYDDARRRVVDTRNKLNLDEPKIAKGTFDELVRV